MFCSSIYCYINRLKTRHFPQIIYIYIYISPILYENDHDLSNGRSMSLAFFKYKRPVESLFGISNNMNGNAIVSWPRSSLYTFTVHFHCDNLWPWPSKRWKSCNKHFWNLLLKMNSLIYNNLYRFTMKTSLKFIWPFHENLGMLIHIFWAFIYPCLHYFHL